jgi:hypothetical protein
VDSAFSVLAIEDTNSSCYGSERNVTFLHFIVFLLLFYGSELMTGVTFLVAVPGNCVELLPSPGKTRWSLSCRDRSVCSFKCHLMALCVRIITVLASLVSTKCKIFMVIVISLLSQSRRMRSPSCVRGHLSPSQRRTSEIPLIRLCFYMCIPLSLLGNGSVKMLGSNEHIQQ